MSEDAPAPQHAPVVLLVDDHEAVRNVVRMMLERGGYTVLDAGSPARAEELSRRHVGALALLITDVHLPGTSGRALAQQLCTERPGLRVLYISGSEVVEPAHAGEATSAFLRKPFRSGQLLGIVASLLAAGTCP